VKAKIIFLGPLPPPYMGPSIATEIILNSRLKDEFELIHLDTSDHRNLSTLGVVDFQNIYLALKHYCILIWMIITRWPEMVYIPISQTTKGYLRDSVFILISKLFGKKVVCHLRGGNFKNWLNSASSLTQWFVRHIHSLVDGQIVLGKSLKNLFDEILPESKIFVVPNGRDFNFENKKIKKYDDRKNNNLKILFLSNLAETKGYKDVLYSAKRVIHLQKNITYIFAGEWRNDEDRKECEKYMEKENIGGHVNFKGTIIGETKLRLLNEADIFVFPTYYPPEGHPWVIVEAVAAGLPIISTDQGAITESVIDGVNGFIVEKQNPQQIAEKINLLIENPELRIKMGKESRRLYLENFTEDKMVERMGYCFNKVLNPYDIKTWYDGLAEKWGRNYYLHDKHFNQRFRNVYQLVNELTDKSNILDIGCATGEITASLHDRFRCNTTGLDISDRMIELCKSKYSNTNLHFEVGDITNLRFQNSEFDLILSSSVIEWINDYEKAIVEVSRVLKRGGQWIVSLPNWDSPFRKAEKLKKIFFKNSYLRYQKNHVSISEFERIAQIYGLKKTKSIFHVLPFYKSNLSGKIGPLLGMMCMMSMTKS
jgi:glycosyltransferase involved in cell wall biosynthesis/ubiquinone/menaquinone biosynthesis C-methylase UbiE